jgi:sulfate transport system substrate-binding protein
VFASGKGDVLLTYENEAIYANKKGVHTDYVLPKQTILIENPVALTKSGVKKPEAKAFEKFLWSSKAQKLFGDAGYRPVLKSVARNGKYSYKKPKSLFTINSKALGLRGWKSVQYRFFDHSNGLMVKVIGH